MPNILLIRQMMGAIAVNDPGIIEEAADLETLIEGDPLSERFAKALARVKTANPIQIAEWMSKGKDKFSPEQVTAEFLNLAVQWGEVNPRDLLNDLRRNVYAARELGVLERILQERRVGEISPEEAAERIAEFYASTASDDGAIIKSSEMGTFAAKFAEERRQMLKYGHLITFQSDIPSLQVTIPHIEPGTMVVVAAPSGTGKSIFASNFAAHVRKKHKATVLYAMTELLPIQMLWREINRITGITTEELSKGFWDQRCTDALKQAPGEADLIYYECGNKKVAEILAQAKKHKANVIIIDYFDMLNFPKKSGETLPRAMKDEMTACKAYAQREKAIIFIVGQFTKEGTALAKSGGVPTSASIGETIGYEQRGNYNLIMTFARSEATIKIPDIMAKANGTPALIEIGEGEYMPSGKIYMDKLSFQKKARPIPVWRDGARMRIVETEEIPIGGTRK